MNTTVQKPINDIIIDIGINTLPALDDALVEEYRREMTETYGETEWQKQWLGLPKITQDDYLWSGFHTIEAAIRAFGDDHVIEFSVEGENRDEALLLATGENAKRGRKPKQAEKRIAVHRWLTHPEGKLWTNAHIASKCNVGDDLVKTVLDELSLVSDAELYDPNYERPTRLKYINKHGQEAFIDTTNLGKRADAPTDTQTELNLSADPKVKAQEQQLKLHAITEYAHDYDALEKHLMDFASGLSGASLSHPKTIAIDFDYIRHYMYYVSEFHGFAPEVANTVETEALLEQSGIARNIVAGADKAALILEELTLFDEVIALYTELTDLGEPFTPESENVLQLIATRWKSPKYENLSRDVRIETLEEFKTAFPDIYQHETEARAEIERQRIADAQHAEAQKSQIEIERKLLIVNEEANRLLQVYTESDIVRPFDEVLEVAAETFNVDLKVLTAITRDHICEDTTNPLGLTSEALSNWRLTLISILQGIEQRSEWSKSMMRDESGCHAALQWILKMELKLTNDVIDIQNLSDTYNLTHDEVLRVKDTVFTYSLAEAKDQHKAIRKECRETWQNDTGLSESVKWRDVCIHACRVYPDLSIESFNGVRTTPDYQDYRTLRVEIARLESMKDDLLNRAEWVASLLPDPNAPVQSYKITAIAINVVESDTDVDEYKDRVTVYLKRSVHSDPQRAACIRITEQLKALAIQAIESQE